ncbi:MAG TPA: tubulin-like doman-containing protein, partial [Thermoanaerobaculia bacterium]
MINLTARLFPQPTLSLYLGGSGIAVGEQLLSLLGGLDPADAAFVEPFFIDSQEPRIRDHERARHFCYTDLDQFFQPIYREFSNTRFPENLGVDPVYNSSEGCGVTRIFGAASLAASLDDFANLVEQAVARLKNRRRAGKQPLQVFLTASACGGTGAGMIVDAAALVRHFCRAKGENPRIFLFLLGPSVYFEDPSVSMTGEQRDRMRASTYALLKELNHFAKGERFVSSYRLRDEPLDIGNVADGDRLFDWVYLLDGSAQKAGATRTLDEVGWMTAETQLHLAMSEVGRKVAESMPNQREQRGREYALNFVHPDNKSRMSDASRKRLQVAGRKTFLASFALRNVRFPAEDIKEWFRAGWVREALQKALLREDPERGVALI